MGNLQVCNILLLTNELVPICIFDIPFKVPGSICTEHTLTICNNKTNQKNEKKKQTII